MRVLLASPFLEPFYDGLLTERKTIAEIMATSGDMEWCAEFVVVRLNGITIPRVWWAHVTVKPEAAGTLHLCVIPQKGNILPILASVALVALTAGIGTFGLPFLGAAFAAGTFGASAAAAAVGIAGSLAINMLTAPSMASAGTAGQNDLSQAGISQNQVALLETLPVVFGTMLVSPPLLAPAYTTLDNEELTVHAIVGLQGRCAINNILVNGTDITLLESCDYETLEGADGGAALTLAQLTCIQQNDQVPLSNFRTRLETSSNDQLEDQTTPDNSAPDYHYFTTDGTVDEIWLRFLFPNGIVYTPDPNDLAVVPIRVEIRKLGDSTWRALPTMHVTDYKYGSGPLRVEVKLKFQTQPSGRHFSNANDEYPIFDLNNITGIGETFEYESDAYFQNTAWPFTDQVPVMTAATTSGVTMSASSELDASHVAWKACDGNQTTGWQPSNNSLPAWLKFDLGSATTIRSYALQNENGVDAALTTSPLTWYVEGSNDDSTWTRLDDQDVDISSNPFGTGYYQIGTPGSYRYYRFNFLTNNRAANDQIRVEEMALYLYDAPGTAFGADYSTYSGNPAVHNDTADPRCVYGSLDKNGATFYLDPAQWLPGAYEVRVKRGVGFKYNLFTPYSYVYNGSDNKADFFDYFTSGNYEVIRIGQKNFRSDTVLEVFSSVSNDVPVDTTGIACIALELKNTVINSVSAEFTSTAPVWDGDVWTDALAVTANPAALYRHLLLSYANPDPTPGEIINEDDFVTWYNRCVAAGHEVNAVVQGRSLDEVKRMIAYCGYASPRDSNMVSIIEDYDRSAESITQMISPLNSRNLGSSIALPKLPHAIYAEYLDAADDWKVRRDIIYRRGFDVNTASYFDTITYDGFTDTAAVAARAAFDLLQLELRSASYSYELGIEGYSIERGDLIGLNDDTLDVKMAQGLIVSIQTSGANITGITVDNVVPFAANQDDLEALMEGLDLANATGVGIRLDDGTVTIKTLTDVADSKVCTFTTPFASSGSGIEVGQMAVFGVAGKSFRRCIVHAVVPSGTETRTVTLRDEAPELFA